MRRSRGLVPILVAGAVLVPPAGAGAAEVVGSNLAAAPNSGQSINTTRVQTVQPTAATLSLTPTASGVIVSITLKHGVSGADPGTYGFRVLSGTSPEFTARIPAELADFVPPANTTPGTLTFTPTTTGNPGGPPKGIPIEAGERVGLTRIGGTTGQGLNTAATGATGGQLRQTSSVHNSGPATYSTVGAVQEITMQYLVEPDADRDGFGDETQDLCATSALTQGTCPLPPVVQPTTAPAKKKCKKPKKKGKGAGAAAKKKPKGCKKPKRKKK